MVREGVVPSKPGGLDRHSTDEGVGVGESVRDAGCPDRPGGVAAVDAADERKRPAAVVIDPRASSLSGQRVVCALEGEARCARAELDAPRLRFEVRVAV
jgi:hypothetical protein